MCEHDSSDDILRGNELSRRRFGALGLGASHIDTGEVSIFVRNSGS